MKGVGPVSVAIVVLVVTIFWGFFLVNAVSRIEAFKRVAQETEIIKAINNVEIVKRELPLALAYSINQASYSISSNGGYSSLDEVESLFCIPYWRTYDKVIFPEYQNNFANLTLKIFNEYGISLTGNVIIPAYNRAEINNNIISISSSAKIRAESDFYTVSDSLPLSKNFNPNFFRVFEVAKTEILEKRISGKDFDEFKNNFLNLQSNLNSKYSGENIELVFDPKNILSDNKNFASLVLVKVIDRSSKIVAFDYDDNSISNRDVMLQFYILDGNTIVEPQVSPCNRS